MDDDRSHQPLDAEINSESSTDSWILIEDGSSATSSESHTPIAIDDRQEPNDDEQIVSSTTTTYDK